MPGQAAVRRQGSVNLRSLACFACQGGNPCPRRKAEAAGGRAGAESGKAGRDAKGVATTDARWRSGRRAEGTWPAQDVWLWRPARRRGVPPVRNRCVSHFCVSPSHFCVTMRHSCAGAGSRRDRYKRGWMSPRAPGARGRAIRPDERGSSGLECPGPQSFPYSSAAYSLINSSTSA